MRTKPFTIFRRIYFVVFLLIALLGLLFTGVTYLATTSFYEASTQLLNKDVAAHIAKFTSPYGREGFDRQKADSVFYNAMVISPSAEVYFLDTTGRVIYFHGGPSEIKSWQVSLGHIRRYIRSGGQKYINGPDPRDPAHPKIFSAAAVGGETSTLGYIYVILGNQQYRSVTQMLYNSRVTPMVLWAFTFILALSLIVTMWYLQRVRLRFKDMMTVFERFRGGDFTARFTVREDDELEPVTGSFNKMADLLLDNIDRVTASEKERRDFMVNISHDLRTPLAIARGYAETLLLKKGQLSAVEEKQYGELVAGKISQVEKMVNQLFDLSKMESATFTPHREPFVFSEILQEVIYAVGSGDATGGKGWRGIPDCSGCTDGSWVEGDVSMMERVLQNLLVNACSYTHDHGNIRISLQRTATDLVFRIENEGDALPADLLHWLNATGPELPVNRPARPAIGLTIVRKILLLHHFPFQAEALPCSVKGAFINAVTFRMPVYKATGND